MDFIIGILKLYGRDGMYVVMDRSKKFAHFFVISSTTQHHRWMSHFSRRCLDYMGYLSTLLVIGTTSF